MDERKVSCLNDNSAHTEHGVFFCLLKISFLNAINATETQLEAAEVNKGQTVQDPEYVVDENRNDMWR